jgi:hypothetical protein
MHLNAHDFLNNLLRVCFEAARECLATESAAEVAKNSWVNEFNPLKPDAPTIILGDDTLRPFALSLSPDKLVASVNVNPFFGYCVASCANCTKL